MAKKSEEDTRRWSIAGVAIPAGVLGGMGYGFLVGNITAGLFMGLGVGFFLMFIGMLIMYFKKPAS
jgi:hypothetical protein